MAGAIPKKARWTLPGVLAVLAGLTVVALILTRNPQSNFRLSHPAPKPAASSLVDQSALNTAESLAASATTPDEQALAAESLRLADQVVDLNFSAALRAASRQPAKATPESAPAQDQMKQAQARVEADQADVTRLATQLAKAKPAAAAALDQQSELAKAQLALDQDELADAQRDLARAEGSTQATLQEMLDEHEKSVAHAGANEPAAASGAAASPLAGLLQPTPRSLISRLNAWFSYRAQQGSIAQARADAQARLAAVTAEHDALEQSIKAKSASAPHGPAESIEAIHQLSAQQQTLGDYDKLIAAEQELAGVYNRWETAAQTAGQTALHRVFRSLLWILLLLLITLMADRLISRLFLNLETDLKRLHAVRTVLRFTIRATGTILILVVIFGPPNQLATVLALAGAGLTVALKDFIVAFFGWFVLLGRHGMRPGDWVEINGVQGKVQEVGLLHTVILETGNWTGAGHPTGRKVTCVNTFAIEGHYFNFSTSGQWLWDELQVGVPKGIDPGPVVHALEKLVSAETAPNVNPAEQEWKRYAAGAGLRSFSAKPVVVVRPTDAGMVIVIRYVTRADDRVGLRSKLYRAAFDLLAQNGVAAHAGGGSTGIA